MQGMLECVKCNVGENTEHDERDSKVKGLSLLIGLSG